MRNLSVWLASAWSLLATVVPPTAATITSTGCCGAPERGVEDYYTELLLTVDVPDAPGMYELEIEYGADVLVLRYQKTAAGILHSFDASDAEGAQITASLGTAGPARVFASVRQRPELAVSTEAQPTTARLLRVDASPPVLVAEQRFDPPYEVEDASCDEGYLASAVLDAR